MQSYNRGIQGRHLLLLDILPTYFINILLCFHLNKRYFPNWWNLLFQANLIKNVTIQQGYPGAAPAGEQRRAVRGQWAEELRRPPPQWRAALWLSSPPQTPPQLGQSRNTATGVCVFLGSEIKKKRWSDAQLSERVTGQFTQGQFPQKKKRRPKNEKKK